MKFRCNERFYIEGPDGNAKGEALMSVRSKRYVGEGRVRSLIGAYDAMCDPQSTTHSTVTLLMYVGSI